MIRTILIAEDNPDLLQVLSLQFDWRGYRVLQAHDGVEALEQVNRGPDLLLLDVMMPRKNGFEVCRSLKSDPALRDLPVILVSGREGEMYREWGLECGADAYLIKPFGITELERRVGELLERSQKSSSPPRWAPGAAQTGKLVTCRWAFDPLAARVYRQKYGELAYRRLLRELPAELIRRLESWGVNGSGRGEVQGAVTLRLPAPRQDLQGCLERLAAIGNDYLRACYDSGDAERGAVVLRDPAEPGAELRFPLLKLIPRPVPDEGETG